MSITIKKTSVNPAVAFDTLSLGDPFLFNNKLCIKVRCDPIHSDSYETAIVLETGEELGIYEDTACVPDNSMRVWKAATMGLVISLANPHKANKEVTKINERR